MVCVKYIMNGKIEGKQIYIGALQRVVKTKHVYKMCSETYLDIYLSV
jgi:hypothetical protein